VVHEPGPIPTGYLASLAPADQFAALAAAEARHRGGNHIRQLVVPGDGAPWIWNLATAIVPQATPIVDLDHARRHLHDLAARRTPSWAPSTPTGRRPGWPTSTPATSKPSSPERPATPPPAR
jgi:hypothetical protein